MSVRYETDISSFHPAQRGFLLGAGDFLAAEKEILHSIGMQSMSVETRERIASIEIVIGDGTDGIAYSKSDSTVVVSAPLMLVLYQLFVRLAECSDRESSSAENQEEWLLAWTAPDVLASSNRSEVTERFKIAQLFMFYHEVCHIARGHHDAKISGLSTKVEPHREALAEKRQLSSRELSRKFFELDADSQAAAFTMQRISAGPISRDYEGKNIVREIDESMKLVHEAFCILFVLEDFRLSSGRTDGDLFSLQQAASTVYPHPFVRWLNASVFARMAQRRLLREWEAVDCPQARMDSSAPDLSLLEMLGKKLGLPGERWKFENAERQSMREEGIWNVCLYDSLRLLFSDDLNSWN